MNLDLQWVADYLVHDFSCAHVHTTFVQSCTVLNMLFAHVCTKSRLGFCHVESYSTRD